MQFDMGLKGTSVLLKYLIFVFNLIFVILGIVLISVGAAIKAEYTNYEWFLDNRFFSVPALLIATGTIIFVVAFCGCCGVVRENHCMVITFSVLLVVIFILEISAGIAGYVLRDNARYFIHDKLHTSMQHYNDVSGSAFVWDTVQRKFGCCGADSWEDWVHIFNTNGTLPSSCCHYVVQQWGGESCNYNSTNINNIGCVDFVETYVSSHAATLGGIGVAIAIVQFLGMVFACSLAKSIRNKTITM